MELAGKTALLTGATGGLGRAISSALAQRGVTLVLSARKPEALQELSDSLPGEHRISAADLALEGAAERLAADAGEVDCLVANAGMSGTGSLESFSTDEVTRAIRVNLEAPMVLARALAPGMVDRGQGQIVFIASLAGKSASPRSSIYNAIGFGLRFASRSAPTSQEPAPASRSSRLACARRRMFAKSGARSTAGLGTTTPGRGGGRGTGGRGNLVEVAVA